MKRILGLSKGQIAVLYAGILAVLLGAVAMGTDVGVMYYQWMAMQRGIDSAALAGVQSLPNAPATAATTVTTYANNNGVKTAEISAITCIDAANAAYSCSNTASQPAGFTPVKVQVDATRVQPYYFARALGMTSVTLNVSSTAFLPNSPSCLSCCVVNCNSSSPPGSPGGPSPTNVPVSPVSCGGSTGQYDIIPAVVDVKTAALWSKGGAETLNRADSTNGPWGDAPGNWGMVDLCGSSNGGAELRSSIADGFYGSMSVGQTIQTEPGAKVGPVGQGFNDRLGGTDSPGNWVVGDPRAVIVPLADFSTCTGRCTITIKGFMSFYIDSYSGGQIQGHFISMIPGNSVNVYAATDAGVSGDAILIK
jgi:Flp pilus assembly protein TadG